MQCYCKVHTLASVLRSATLSFRRFWLCSRTQESSSFPALLASETPCAPELPPAGISLRHSGGDSGQVGPTRSSGVVVRSMISWGSWRPSLELPCPWAVTSSSGHSKSRSPWAGERSLARTPCRATSFPSRCCPPGRGGTRLHPPHSPQQPYAAGYCTTVCQNPSVTWFPSSFLTLDF